MRLALILALALLTSARTADASPQVAVGNIRRVFHNGEHNAFTDLCRFYLTFRSCPDGHMVNPTASVIILRSADDGALQEFAELPSGDNSYPGFVALSPTRALVSYYSSHEKDGAGKTIIAIYMAELSLKP